MRYAKSRNAGKHSSYPGSGSQDAMMQSGEVRGTRYEEAVPPIYTGPLPQVPEGIEPPIYTGPLPVVPTGPQIQPPRPQPPTGPQIQPPRPQPPRPQPPTRPQPPRPQPPAYAIPPYGQLPQLDITLRNDQSLGVGDCLAPSSAVYAPQLEEYIRQELRLYLSFSAWADRYPTRSSALRTLAAENLNRAKILLRAYSFITDVYYWPTYLQPLVPLTSYSREMRQLYNALNTLEQSYLSSYRRSLDSCLASVYLGLADRTENQKQRMNRVL